MSCVRHRPVSDDLRGEETQSPHTPTPGMQGAGSARGYAVSPAHADRSHRGHRSAIWAMTSSVRASCWTLKAKREPQGWPLLLFNFNGI